MDMTQPSQSDQLEVFLGKGADDFAEYFGSGKDIFWASIFRRIMADAIFTGDEDHAGGTVTRPVHAVMAGAARHGKCGIAVLFRCFLHQSDMAGCITAGVSSLTSSSV